MILTFKLKTECLRDAYVKSRRQKTLGTENNSCETSLRDVGELGLLELDTNSECLRSDKKASGMEKKTGRSGIRVRKIAGAGSCRGWILF